MKKKENNKHTVAVKFSNPEIERAEHYIRMVAIGSLNGCILVGPPGMGKTFMVTNILEEMEKEYVTFGGHISLAGTYEFLYEHRDELIFFDDVSQVINKTEIMEMLKQALNTENKQRRLSYKSKNVLGEGIKPSFDFTGQIIFAFNLMDNRNENVRAIMDRAPCVTLKFSRKEIFEAMYKIAESDCGELMDYEKLVVTKEIEKYTDSSMDVSLRKQALAFKIYASFKRLFGEGNNKWVAQVQSLFGKKRRSWLEDIILDLVGDSGKIRRMELVKEIAVRKDMSVRTAQRKIKEFLDMEIIFENKSKGGDISLKPFK